ncbi:MFS transporter [Neptunicella sp. SCSIO 80796]|uniref:MFS transporter n=1 Tax=Neptunicella plasticusilytica TaxID=3117012 RepID=UPI003A4DC3D9
MTNTQANLVLFTTMLVSIISTIGIALPYPILAPLLLTCNASHLSDFMQIAPNLLLAALLGVYPMGMLIGSSFMGALSDSYGRRKVLLLSLLFSTCGYVLTVIAVINENYLLFLMARFITGLFEGNISIVRAIAADLDPIIDKARSFSWLYATTYLGWLIGPLMGGYLMQFSAATAFYAAALAVGLSALFVWLWVPETATTRTSDKASLLSRVSNENSFGLLKHSSIRHIFLIYLLIMLGLNGLYEFLPVWLVEQFQFGSVQIGWANAMFTLLMVLTSAFVAERLKNKFGLFATIAFGLASLATLMLSVFWIPLPYLYLYVALMGIANALYNGLLPVFITDKFSQQSQGRLLGLLSSIFCLANMLFALIGGIISLLGAQWSIFCGGLMLLSGLIYLLIFNRRIISSANHLSLHPGTVDGANI